MKVEATLIRKLSIWAINKRRFDSVLKWSLFTFERPFTTDEQHLWEGDIHRNDHKIWSRGEPKKVGMVCSRYVAVAVARLRQRRGFSTLAARSWHSHCLNLTNWLSHDWPACVMPMTSPHCLICNKLWAALKKKQFDLINCKHSTPRCIAACREKPYSKIQRFVKGFHFEPVSCEKKWRF